MNAATTARVVRTMATMTTVPDSSRAEHLRQLRQLRQAPLAAVPMMHGINALPRQKCSDAGQPAPVLPERGREDDITGRAGAQVYEFEVSGRERPQELEQARYFRALLEERQEMVDAELTLACGLLARHLAAAGRDRMPRIREAIKQMRREQYRIFCLLESLNSRFFRLPPVASPVRTFSIKVEMTRRGRRLRVPELDEVVATSRGADIEMAAREHIAVHLGTAISRIAVRISSSCPPAPAEL